MIGRLLVLRLVLALMCAAFAWFFGRALAGRRIPGARRTRPGSWAVRTLLAAFGVVYLTGFDALAIGTLATAVVAAVVGFLVSRRPPRPPEDLTRQIFPD
jgi:hypothetical protein